MMTDVPRETYLKIKAYRSLLERWMLKQNLVGPNGLSDWEDLLQEAQCMSMHIQGNSIIDLGSGSGLPGILLRIFTGKNVDLLDKDRRKCFFLEEAARITQTNGRILNKLISKVDKIYESVTAKGLGTVKWILDNSENLRDYQTTYVLAKGTKGEHEILEALQTYSFDSKMVSINDQGKCLIVLTHVVRR